MLDRAKKESKNTKRPEFTEEAFRNRQGLWTVGKSRAGTVENASQGLAYEKKKKMNAPQGTPLGTAARAGGLLVGSIRSLLEWLAMFLFHRRARAQKHTHRRRTHYTNAVCTEL